MQCGKSRGRLPKIQHLERRESPTVAKVGVFPEPVERHGPCLIGEHMSLSGRLRSWVVLPVVAVLLGTPVLPLALCAAGDQVPCAADMPQQAASHHGCDESEAPQPASMTCCCDRDAGNLPLIPTTLTELAGAPLAITASPVDLFIPGEAAPGAIESTVLLTRHQPLFTLFSTFLI